MTYIARALLLGTLLTAGCGKDKAADNGKTAGSGPAPTAEKEKAAPDLASSPEPAGVTWKKLEQPFGTIDAPADYQLVENQLESKDGTVIMLQAQDGITPDQLDEYMASYDEVQKRDAPKYGGASTTKGTLGGAVAARVDATFDNGTAFVTRDFVVFTKGKVVMLSARTPKTNAAALPGIIDHVARSFVAK